MRDRLPLALTGGLVMLAVLGSVIISNARRGSFADRLSTYRSEPDGARALFLLLSNGDEVTRWQRSLEDLPAHQTFVLLGARLESAHESASVFGESNDGGLGDDWSPDERADFKQRGLHALRSPQVTNDETKNLLRHVREGGSLIYIPWRHEQNTLLDALDVELLPPRRAEGIRTLVPALPSPFTAGVERIEARVDSFLQLPAAAVPLLADEASGDVSAALITSGQGKVIIITASELAMNSALARADNAQFWKSILRALGGSNPVAFDEFHHGFTGQRSLGEFAARSGLHIAIAQLLLGIVLWALALRRFGRAREPVEALRVGTTDALFATSRLYREGRHFDHAAQIILKQLTFECAARAGVAPGSASTAVSAALDARGRKDLAAALLAVTHAANGVSSDTALEKVARLAALTRMKLHAQKALTP